MSTPDSEEMARTKVEDVDEAAVEAEFRETYNEVEGPGKGGDSAANIASVLLLRVALRNEKAAPELIEFEAEVVADVERALNKQEETIAEIRGSARGRALQHMVLQMEFDRVRYLLLEYLRVRLRKIQKFGLYLMKHEELHTRMSESEFAFCKEFINLDAEHMQRLLLDRLPKVFRKYTEENMVPSPDLDSFVFCRVQTDIGDMHMDDDGDDVANLQKGDLVAVRYNPIRELVENGSVVLV